MEQLNQQPTVRRRRSDRYKTQAAQAVQSEVQTMQPAQPEARAPQAPQPAQPAMTPAPASKPPQQLSMWGGGATAPIPAAPAQAMSRTARQPAMMAQQGMNTARTARQPAMPIQAPYGHPPAVQAGPARMEAVPPQGWRVPGQVPQGAAAQQPVANMAQPAAKPRKASSAKTKTTSTRQAKTPVRLPNRNASGGAGGGRGGNGRTGGTGGKGSKGRGNGSSGGGQLRGLYRVVVLIIAVVLIAAIVVVGRRNHETTMARQALAAEVHAYDGLFCEGVYVDGIDLGGMTQQEATDAVVAQAEQKRDSWYVTLTYGDRAWTLNADQLGIRVSLEQAMDSAWAQGHVGNDEERKVAMDSLRAEPFHAYTSLPGGDTSVVDGLLAQIAQEIYAEPQDAAVIGFDAELTDPFIFHEEVVGCSLNTEGLREQLYEMVSTMTSGQLSLEESITHTYPAVTVADLRKTVVAERFTADTRVSSTSTDERNANISLAMQFINGTVLKPGEVFSFNDTVGERTAARGFKSAIEYQNGEEVMGIGGGACQASTTVYQAALRAGLEIVDRSPHGMQVGYSDYGMDATVYWSSGREIDLKFRNNTNSDIYIKTSMVWKDKRWHSRCTIYGEAMEPGVTYDFAIEQEILPAPIEVKEVRDRKGQYVVYVDEEPYVYQEAKDGLKVTSYQVKYLNGMEVARTFIDTDTYAAKQKIVYVGVTNR